MSKIFEKTKQAFDLPAGMIYLDGNSLGPMCHASRARLVDEMDNQWSKRLIGGWNESGWYHLSQTVGDKIAALIGAPIGSVTAVDSTSINLYKSLHAALSLNSERRVILSDKSNFPSDLYVAQGIVEQLNKHAVQPFTLKIVEAQEIVQAIDESVAVVMVTQVDYATGRILPIADIVKKALHYGAKTILDLCHSAGALEVDLVGLNVDFAIGCGYKYFNGGPGAPAFIYVKAEHLAKIEPVLNGWMGHARPFDFDLKYRPANSINKMRVGTPSILGLASLDAALDVWQGVSLKQVRKRSIELSELFIQEISKHTDELMLASPIDPQLRGSQVSFRFDQGYALVQALIAQGVVGDFRMPNIVRFGITPLYLGEADIVNACEKIVLVLEQRLWDQPQFKVRSAVT